MVVHSDPTAPNVNKQISSPPMDVLVFYRRNKGGGVMGGVSGNVDTNPGVRCRIQTMLCMCSSSKMVPIGWRCRIHQPDVYS
jgi:hypothetical protein